MNPKNFFHPSPPPPPPQKKKNLTQNNQFSKQKYKKGEEKLKLCRKVTVELNAEIEGLKKEELKDGFTYTHTDSSGVRVLDDTSTTNRKAIFHDLYLS